MAVVTAGQNGGCLVWSVQGITMDCKTQYLSRVVLRILSLIIWQVCWNVGEMWHCFVASSGAECHLGSGDKHAAEGELCFVLSHGISYKPFGEWDSSSYIFDITVDSFGFYFRSFH
jgi:hypothetical protein